MLCQFFFCSFQLLFCTLQGGSRFPICKLIVFHRPDNRNIPLLRRPEAFSLFICQTELQLCKFYFFFFYNSSKLFHIETEKDSSGFHPVPILYIQFFNTESRQHMKSFLPSCHCNTFYFHHMFHILFFHCLRFDLRQSGNIDTFGNNRTYPHENKEYNKSTSPFFHFLLMDSFFFTFHLYHFAPFLCPSCRSVFQARIHNPLFQIVLPHDKYKDGRYQHENRCTESKSCLFPCNLRQIE